MTREKVLIGVDGSDWTREVARQAIDMLGRGNTYTVARVIQSPIALDPLPLSFTQRADVVGATNEAIVADAEADVEDTVAILGLKAEPRVLAGTPGPALAQLAKECAFDLIVVGSHGSGMLKRMLLGSTSHYLVQHAPCPVLVIRSEAEEAA
jgi:nucleotide-binding universal stress UspA family protein